MQKVTEYIKQVFKKSRLDSFENQTVKYNVNLIEFEKKTKQYYTDLYNFQKREWLNAKFIEYDGSNEFENCNIYIDDYEYCCYDESVDEESNYYQGIRLLMKFLGKEKMSINQFVCTELRESHLSGYYCEIHNCESILENENEKVFYVNGKVYCDYCVRFL